MGKPILIDEIRLMVANITTDAEDLLWRRLMFKEGKDVRFTIPLAELKNNLTQSQRGRSFVHANGLAGREVEILEDLVAGSRKGDFLDREGEWKWDAIRAYLRLVKKFEEFLLLLGHFTGGQPSRGEEITGLRLVNSINRDRNVFVIDGDVILVTQYHKSQAYFNSPRVIPRFLPGRVGQLFAMYMIYIRPLTDRWEADHAELYGTLAPPSDFIWHTKTGPWKSKDMSAAVAKWTLHYIGLGITLQGWRHIAITISKKHARKRGVTRGDFEGSDNKGDNTERYEVPDDLAACHTSQTSANYGVTIDMLKRLTAESLEVFGQVSSRWHRFLGCDGQQQQRATGSQQPTAYSEHRVIVNGPGSAKRRLISPPPSTPPPRKRAKATTLERLEADTAAAAGKGDIILRALRAVLRDNSAQFRSSQQEEAIRLAAAKQSPLVAVLPTGGGKSLIFIVPAMLTGAGVTVVVSPYAELKKQIVARCTDASIDCGYWPKARDSWPRITIISAEAAGSDDFLQWAADLSVRGRLDRVVIDECHLLLTAATTYRTKLRDLVLLQNLSCPFVFLTGTLPPLLQRHFEEAMLLQSPLYIRSSSHRPNVQYSVVRVRNGRGIIEVKKMVQARIEHLSPGQKGMIYCTTHAKCRAVALQTGYPYYHSQPNNGNLHCTIRREEGLRKWLSGEMAYIVATAALGTGIDVPGITHIIHLEAPYSIIDYAQESGRAGRAGKCITADIVVEDIDWPTESPTHDKALDLGEREVRGLIRTRGCRHRQLGLCLDSDPRSYQDIPAAVSCDNCRDKEVAWKSELSSQGIIASRSRGRQEAIALKKLKTALEETKDLGKIGYRIY